MSSVSSIADLPSIAAVREELARREPAAREAIPRAEACRACFQEFVREFWEAIPGAGKLVWNWHLGYLADELEKEAVRVWRGLPREYDTVVNLPPGTSKSSLYSILFPAWVWTFFPGARILTASYASDLVLDLAGKSRDVVRSEKYRTWFPGISIREDTDAKGHYRNNHGGERKVCTVAGMSPVGFHAHILISDDLLDPKRVLSEAELKSARKFVEEVLPSRVVDKAVSAFFLVMQRLGLGDPTDVVLEVGSREGSIPVRHVCLPSDLDPLPDGSWDPGNVSPPELAENYVDGLLDPSRMARAVLRSFQARGALYYATQFRQKPYASGGGLFRMEFFNKRKKAAPYENVRVRYWDKAASEGATACRTAGVLIGRDVDGNFYIEHVVAGRWEPEERDRKILATAFRDRSKYGPRYEPVIWLEHEPGSGGVDSYRYTARKLAGFPVHPDRPSGRKEVRAEPWSAQLAAGNVYVVEDGTWEVYEYVQEHCSFPAGPLKDLVDASSGAFLKLVNTQPAGSLRTLPLGPGKRGSLRLVACSHEELAVLTVDNLRSLLVSVSDPEVAPKEVVSPVSVVDPDAERRSIPVAPGAPANESVRQPEGSRVTNLLRSPEPPPHALLKLLDWLPLEFADLDPADWQDRWEAPLPPWDRPPSELVLQRDAVKKLWAFLLKKRPDPPELMVFADGGGEDGRALSLAGAVQDALGLGPEALWRPAAPEAKRGRGDRLPNPFVGELVRNGRHSVVG
jgi:predicted phage terminase large subunit-like protein